MNAVTSIESLLEMEGAPAEVMTALQEGSRGISKIRKAFGPQVPMEGPRDVFSRDAMGGNPRISKRKEVRTNHRFLFYSRAARGSRAESRTLMASTYV